MKYQEYCITYLSYHKSLKITTKIIFTFMVKFIKTKKITPLFQNGEHIICVPAFPCSNRCNTPPYRALAQNTPIRPSRT